MKRIVFLYLVIKFSLYLNTSYGFQLFQIIILSGEQLKQNKIFKTLFFKIILGFFWSMNNTEITYVRFSGPLTNLSFMQIILRISSTFPSIPIWSYVILKRSRSTI